MLAVLATLAAGAHARNRPIRETDEADVSPVDTVVEDDSVAETDEEARKMKKKDADAAEDTEMVEADEDEEMMDCDSCSKNFFKSSNKLFCKACSSKKNKKRACEKCATAENFRNKHSSLCKSLCSADEDELEDIVDSVVEDVVDEVVKKNKKNKNKKNKNKKNKNKNSFAMEMDEDEDYEVEEPVEKTQDEINDEKLGVFGKILKALIVANTWVRK